MFQEHEYVYYLLEVGGRMAAMAWLDRPTDRPRGREMGVASIYLDSNVRTALCDSYVQSEWWMAHSARSTRTYTAGTNRQPEKLRSSNVDLARSELKLGRT